MPLFDYDLVSTRAAYRSCVPRDFPVLLALAERRSRELKADPAHAREAIALTVAEFSRRKTGGAILLIEVDQERVGYCILANRWSHVQGGTVLCVEELYVAPGHDRLVLAQDLFALLAEIAPGGSVAIRIDAGVADRRLQAACARMGFQQEPDPGMIRQARGTTASGAGRKSP